MITLKANNPIEQRVLDYLILNASEVLATKINAGDKTLAGALRYAKDEARKIADGEDCIAVDDATAFGWIIHFFEEDSIIEKKTRKAVTLPESKKLDEKSIEPKPAKRHEPKQELQPDLFTAITGS